MESQKILYGDTENRYGDNMAIKKHWDKMIQTLLGDDNPCKICAVRVMCKKSFVNPNAGGCPELKEALRTVLRIKENEDKN